ncbi:hypothetical protein chiPu_0026607 [Chiloscyllium punctatum]|uniref:Uncharacterized protein n=1 Tax=Chiloscyllium punctatum TaxID=137246 RepID=A0A401TIL1_CHIPU|nr:hypothetical protein [Chiloscyllium punctatum]
MLDGLQNVLCGDKEVNDVAQSVMAEGFLQHVEDLAQEGAGGFFKRRVEGGQRPLDAAIHRFTLLQRQRPKKKQEADMAVTGQHEQAAGRLSATRGCASLQGGQF